MSNTENCDVERLLAELTERRGHLLPVHKLMAEVDPECPDQSRSVSAGNDLLRAPLTEAMVAQYPDRPALLAKTLPQYPASARRITVHHATWAAALHRVTLPLPPMGLDRTVPGPRRMRPGPGRVISGVSTRQCSSPLAVPR